jgi:CRISPR-associated exonuclease Cas4
VPFDVELRRLTETTALQLGELFAAGQTPLATRHANRCRACPLIELCRPKAAGKSAIAFRARAIAAALDEAADEDVGGEAKKH